MNEQLREDIARFARDNEERIFRDIGRLVAVDSVEGKPEPGAPFGPGPRKALDLALEIARELELETVDLEGMLGYAALGEGERYLATITHLDVVPAGEGWTADPFSLRDREGWILGRGVMDDKGPSVLCLYALRYLKERQIPLRYPVRALLGVNEETRMADVDYYLKNYAPPLFCFSPDANFPLCNGEKGIFHGRITATAKAEQILDLRAGVAANAIPEKARAKVRAQRLQSSERVTAEELEPGVWQLTAHGSGGHASTPEGTVNAIGLLVDYLLDNGLGSDKDRDFLRLLKRLHDNSDGSSLGVQAADGRFEPLTIVGTVAGLEDGRMFQVLDSRYPGSTSGAQIVETINALAGDLAAARLDTDSAPFYMSPDNPAVQVCLRAYNAITGEDAKPYTIGGGTYARHFPNAVSFGPEHPERPQPDFAGPIHGADEGACKAWFLEALQVYILALLELEKLDF